MTRQMGRPIGTECFIDLVLIREWRGHAREGVVGNTAARCGIAASRHGN
jgi:hypothetical protein